MTDKITIVESANGLFAIDLEDKGVSEHLRKYGSYGLDEIERLKPHISPGYRVLIVGAHIGTLALPIAKLCKEVVAIEANPNTYDLLTKNIELNSITNIQAVNIAAGDSEEYIEFLLNTVNSGGSKRVPKVKDFIYYYDNPEVVSVKAVRLDDYLDEKDFDTVVMDIEGSEYYALKGMQQILSTCGLLAIEFLPHHLKNVSGVSVEQFIALIEPHFSTLTIPSKGLELNSTESIRQLTEMYDLDQGDDALIFRKA